MMALETPLDPRAEDPAALAGRGRAQADDKMTIDRSWAKPGNCRRAVKRGWSQQQTHGGTLPKQDSSMSIFVFVILPRQAHL